MITFEGPTACLRAVREPRYPEEEVTVTLINDLPIDRDNRQAYLLETFYYKCECHWCTDCELERKTHSFKCFQEGCEELVSMKHSACSNGHKTTEKKLESVRKQVTKYKEYTKCRSTKEAFDDQAAAAALHLFFTTQLTIYHPDKLSLRE